MVTGTWDTMRFYWKMLAKYCYIEECMKRKRETKEALKELEHR
jgi:hypothetical protein